MVYELDGRYADDSCLRELDGYAYLILRFLSENIEKQYKISDIAGSVGQTKKATKKSLKRLAELELVIEDSSSVLSYKINEIKYKSDLHMLVPIELYDKLQKQEITGQEFLCYLAIRREALAGRSCSQESIGNILGLKKQAVYIIIKRMIKNEIIYIAYKKSIGKAGKGSFVKKYNIYGFPLEDECWRVVE